MDNFEADIPESFYSQDIKQGQMLALELSESGQDIETFLQNNPIVQSVFKINNIYYVKMTNATTWLTLAEDGGSQLPPNSNVRSTVGSPEGENPENNLILNLAWVSDQDAQQAQASPKVVTDTDQNSIRPIDSNFFEKLQKVDDLISSNKYDQAVELINDLIRQYGEDQELVIRLVQTELARGKMTTNSITSEIKSKLERPFIAIQTDDATIYIDPTLNITNLD